MDRNENDIHRAKDSSQRHTKVFRCITTYRGKCLMYILTYLYYTKHNEINIGHSDVKKHLLYSGSHGRFIVYHELYLVWKHLEMYFQLSFMVCFYYAKF